MATESEPENGSKQPETKTIAAIVPTTDSTAGSGDKRMCDAASFGLDTKKKPPPNWNDHQKLHGDDTPCLFLCLPSPVVPKVLKWLTRHDCTHLALTSKAVLQLVEGGYQYMLLELMGGHCNNKSHSKEDAQHLIVPHCRQWQEAICKPLYAISMDGMEISGKVDVSPSGATMLATLMKGREDRRWEDGGPFFYDLSTKQVIRKVPLHERESVSFLLFEHHLVATQFEGDWQNDDRVLIYNLLNGKESEFSEPLCLTIPGRVIERKDELD